MRLNRSLTVWTSATAKRTGQPGLKSTNSSVSSVEINARLGLEALNIHSFNNYWLSMSSPAVLPKKLDYKYSKRNWRVCNILTYFKLFCNIIHTYIHTVYRFVKVDIFWRSLVPLNLGPTSPNSALSHHWKAIFYCSWWLNTISWFILIPCEDVAVFHVGPGLDGFFCVQVFRHGIGLQVDPGPSVVGSRRLWASCRGVGGKTDPSGCLCFKSLNLGGNGERSRGSWVRPILLFQRRVAKLLPTTSGPSVFESDVCLYSVCHGTSTTVLQGGIGWVSLEPARCVFIKEWR